MSLSKKSKKLLVIILAICIFIAGFIAFNYRVLFQRGNFFPYLFSASELSEEKTFVLVENSDKLPLCHTYISNMGCEEEFIFFIKEKFDAKFKEQAGSSYIFHSGNNSFSISSEIYLGKYVLWDIPSSLSL